MFIGIKLILRNNVGELNSPIFLGEQKKKEWTKSFTVLV